LSAEDGGTASLKHFSTQPIARISGNDGYQTQLSCIKLPTESGERVCANSVHLRARILSVRSRHPSGECRIFIHDHHFTARDAHAIHPNIEGFAGEAVQLQNRARASASRSRTDIFARPTSRAEGLTPHSRIKFNSFRRLAAGKVGLSRRIWHRHRGFGIGVLMEKILKRFLSAFACDMPKRP